MPRLARFATVLFDVLAWGAHAVVVGTTRSWIEPDVALRARAVVSGARQSLVGHWSAPSAMASLVSVRTMRAVVAELNVDRWACRMLVDAASLRRRDRLEGRVSHSWIAVDGPA